MERLRRRRLVVLASCVLASSASAGDVWNVPSVAPNIQLAVNVAAPGDVILVAPGTYTQVVTVDKGVSIVAETSANLATLVVQDLPAGQTFLLDGFTLDLPDVFSGSDTPFTAHDNAGALRFQVCTFRGDPGYAGSWQAGISAYPGAAGAIVENSASVMFHRCTFFGGIGADLDDEDFDWSATAGGHGISVVDSQVALFDCAVTGGHAGSIYDTLSHSAPAGGSAVAAKGASHVEVHGSTLTGGFGGSADCDFFGCGDGGGGGSGIVLSGGATCAVRDDVFAPGQGGGAGGFGAFDGPDGQDVHAPAGGDTWYAQRYRALTLSTPAREGGFLIGAFEGDPGDTVLLFSSLVPAHAPLPLHAGVYGMGSPLLLPGVFVGTVPAGGSLPLLLAIPELGAGVEGFALPLQSVHVDGAGAWLGPVDLVTLLDAAF